MFLDFQEIRDIIVYYAILILAYVASTHVHDIRYPVWAAIVLLSLPLVLPNESKVRKITCFLSFLLVSLLSSWFYIILYLFSPFHPNNLRSTESIETLLTSIFGITYEFRGIENLESHKKAIIIMNHQSVIDTFVVIRLWKWLGSPRAIVKKEVFFFWPIGLATWLCGMIFVEKMAGPRGWNHFMKQAKDHLNSYYERPSILMFPEGKRNSCKTALLPFRKGAFRLAAEMKIPIVPVVISPYTFLDSNSFKRGKVVVTVLDPINEENLGNTDNLDDVVKNIWDLMNQFYKTPVS